MPRMHLTATLSLAASLCGQVLAQNYNAAYDAAWCSNAKGNVDQEMKRLKSQGGVCFAPVYSNGTGQSHLYASAMDRCCKGGTAPVQLNSQGNAPWSDDDEILCARQCVQAEEWPESDVERAQEMSRFSRCMKRSGIEDFGLKWSVIQCEIDDDLLWDGWNEGVRPDGADRADDDDNSDIDPDVDSESGKITGDGKTCPSPRRTFDDIFTPQTDEDDVLNDTVPTCVIPVPKANKDWSRNIFKDCCEGEDGSFPAWPGDESTVHCERLCHPAWDKDQDEEGQLKAVEELNKCFLKPSWSESDGRRPFVACYGLGNVTLESADPTGKNSVEGSDSDSDSDKEGENNGNDDDGNEADENGSEENSDDNSRNNNEAEDAEDGAASYKTWNAGLHIGSFLAVGAWLATSW
ncbi:hypothetical protein CC79DRAFT_464803 [Sarocladium strictum]